jgi:putative ABC transport system ATP-binding protein
VEISIKMRDLRKSYNLGDNKIEVLKGISLDIYKGEFVAILGPSGSGKTTLMNIIGLIDTHDSGDYILEGEDIRNKSENEYSLIRNRKIGFVFQRFNLIPKYSALYNVALPLLLRGEKSAKANKAAKDVLEKIGLGDRMYHKPVELSGGQQQRVAIARAIIGDSNIILADEPTGALDSKTGQEVINMLKELNKDGKTIILITHDMNIASQAKRIIHIKDGVYFEN